MIDPRPPTRDELARVFKDFRTLKAFERIFDLVPGEFVTILQAIDELRVQTSGDMAAAQAARRDAMRLNGLVQQALAGKPQPVNRTPALDYADFVDAPHLAQPGRVAWNTTDDTLNIYHSNNVTQQVGLETYARLINNTGTTIPNGSAVAYAGAASGAVQGALYLADGATPLEYFVGVATQDIANGAVGRVTTFGLVRDLDTSAFTLGDVLYVSSTVAGGLTNVKPTAPAYTLEVGVVTAVSATAGAIFVRPILDLTKRYGKFLKTTDQTPSAINTANTITFDSASISNGVSIGTPSSRIVCNASGLYTFGASYQITSTSASSKNVWLWYRKNGADIANSAVRVTLQSSSEIKAPWRSIFVSMNVGDYVELCWAADDTNVTLDSFASTAFAPAAPAVVLTVDQIQQ